MSPQFQGSQYVGLWTIDNHDIGTRLQHTGWLLPTLSAVG